jgi:hypothetical protein
MQKDMSLRNNPSLDALNKAAHFINFAIPFREQLRRAVPTAYPHKGRVGVGETDARGVVRSRDGTSWSPDVEAIFSAIADKFLSSGHLSNRQHVVGSSFGPIGEHSVATGDDPRLLLMRIEARFREKLESAAATKEFLRAVYEQAALPSPDSDS